MWLFPGGKAVERKAVVPATLPRIVRRRGDDACSFSRRRCGAVASASSSFSSSASGPASLEDQAAAPAPPPPPPPPAWPPQDPSLLPLGPAAPFLLSCPSPEEIVAVGFYHLADLPSARATRRRHEAFLRGRDVRGRIYVAPQGLNAQFSAPAAVAAEYLIWVRNESEKKMEGEAEEGGGGAKNSAAANAVAAAAAQRSLLETMRANAEPSPRGEHLFPKLRLKFKPNLISLAGGTASLPITDPAARAAPLSPRQWEAMLLEEGSERPRPIVLDVRNAYEWDAGHFEGAERPLEDNFCETPTDATSREGAATAAEEESEEEEEGSDDADAADGAPSPPSSSPPLGVPALLASAPKDAPVMMYCTGGIRCDIYSAHLRRKGFTNLYTLEGGVHNYFTEVGGRGWDGSLFVFDARMAVAPRASGGGGGEGPGGPASAAAAAPAAASSSSGDGGGEGEGLPAAAPCLLCGGRASLPHLNCSNIDCNRLFICCGACASRLRGCCCEACVAAPRLLRPAKVAGYYGTWASEAAAGLAGDEGGDAAAAAASLAAARAAMSSGRGSGRLARRRARAERLSQERAAAKEERLRKKAAAKAELAKRDGGGSDEGGGGLGGESERKGSVVGDDERSARLAKLEALRSRLLVRR